MDDLMNFVDLDRCQSPTTPVRDMNFDLSSASAIHPAMEPELAMDWQKLTKTQESDMNNLENSFFEPVFEQEPLYHADHRELIGFSENQQSDEESALSSLHESDVLLTESSEFENEQRQVSQRPKRRASSKKPFVTPEADDLSDIKIKVENSILEESQEYEKMLSDPNLSLKDKRQLKNKIAARQFRLRRKEYVNTLEDELRKMRITNHELKRKNEKLESRVISLSREVSQLRGEELDETSLTRSICTDESKDTVTIRIPPMMRHDAINKDPSELVKSIPERKKRIDALIQNMTKKQSSQPMPHPQPFLYPPVQYFPMPMMRPPPLPVLKKPPLKVPGPTTSRPLKDNVQVEKPVEISTQSSSQVPVPVRRTTSGHCRTQSPESRHPKNTLRIQVHTALIPLPTHVDYYPSMKQIFCQDGYCTKNAKLEGAICDSKEEMLVRLLVLLYLSSKVVKF